MRYQEISSGLRKKRKQLVYTFMIRLALDEVVGAEQ